MTEPAQGAMPDEHSDSATENENTNTKADEQQPEGADALGDAGKKALDTMKAQRNEWRDKYRELQRELEELKTQGAKPEGSDSPDGKEDVQALIAEAERKAKAGANARILQAEIRAAAAGKLADPTDAPLYLDLTKFEVGEGGEVDAEEITDAIDDLIKRKPHLAAQRTPKFGGSDGGPRNGSRPAQLTEADLKSMTPEQIVKAQEEGRLNDLLGAG
jgi:hypothetical protein